MKDDKEHKIEYGFIAQDVEEIYPALVHESDEFKSLNYVGMIAPLVKAVQEQNNRIDSLVKENELLTKRRLLRIDSCRYLPKWWAVAGLNRRPLAWSSKCLPLS